MKIGNVKIVGKNKWRPPRRCRWFGHKFIETEYTVTILGFINVELEVCKRCKCGRVFGFGGYEWYTPDAVERFICAQPVNVEATARKLFGSRRLI